MVFKFPPKFQIRIPKSWAGDKCQNDITYGNFVDTKRITQNAGLN